MNKTVFIALLATLLTLGSCGRYADSVLPKSGGRPYGVCLYANDTACAAVVDSLLSRPAAGLPQPEPQFDVAMIKERQPEGALRYARAILIVDENPSQYTTTSVKYEKNVWARPQIVVYINTPSAAGLKRSLNKSGGAITDLLYRFEINAAISRMDNGAEEGLVKEIRRLTGYDMMVPEDLRIADKGKNFVRMSDNGAEKNENICLYSYPAKGFDPKRAMTVRDSVMAVNLKGERNGMYVATTAGGTTCGMVRERGGQMVICRGLWHMEGDAMGGPFVSVSVLDTAEWRMMVAEALVYAPGRNKRNIIRRLEAALYTMRKSKDK